MLSEGFDGFDAGRRPVGWNFIDCAADEDTYTTEGNYGYSSPSLKLSASSAQVVTPSFTPSDHDLLSFWLKGVGEDVSSNSLLLEEEYYSSWTSLTEIWLSPVGATQGPFPLSDFTTRVRFTFNQHQPTGNLALDDVLIRIGRYMRVYYLNQQRYVAGGKILFGDIAYYEFPGPDGILGTADDVNLLIDGGTHYSTPSALSEFLDEKIGIGGTINHMLCTHAHTDHYRGLHMAVERYTVENYYENYRWPEGDKLQYDDFRDAIDARPINVYYFGTGDYLSGPDTNVGSGWDDHLVVRVLANRSPAPVAGNDPNAYSPIIQLRWGESVFLTGGDAGTTEEMWVVDETAPYSYAGASADLALTDIFQTHHHGSHLSHAQEFLDQMSPLYVIHPVGHGSGSGHPRREAIERIHRTGAVQYRLDLDHHVEVRADDTRNYEISRWLAWSEQTDKRYNPDAPQEFAAGEDFHKAPPPKVTGLEVISETHDHIVLGWESLGADYRYHVHRSLQAGGDDGAGKASASQVDQVAGIYRRLTSAPIAYTTFTDSSAVPGAISYYRVASFQTHTQTGTGGPWHINYERRWSNEAGGERRAFTPSPTPEGFKTPSPPPTATPQPTATPTPAGYKTPSPTATPPSTPPPPSPTPDFSVVHAWNLDTDPGWTMEGGWEFGEPQGLGGFDGPTGGRGNPDPSSAYTGTNVYGYDLTDAGNYPNNMASTEWLTTTAFSCLNVTDTSLAYMRWLNLESQDRDRAFISVSTDGSNWVVVWQDPEGQEPPLVDSVWDLWEHDISAWADNQPSVQVRWGLGPTNHRLRYSGWNLDDIEIWGRRVITPPPTPTATPTPVGYKTPSPTPAICTRINEGFDGFDTGTRPAGWTFHGCNNNWDTYTALGSYGYSPPSIKLDTTGDYVRTEEFLPGEWLQFWVKGQGTDATSSLLVEEYYGLSSFNTVTEIVPLPGVGTVFTGLALNPSTNQVKFTYSRSQGDLALDDVLVKCLPTPTLTPSATPAPTVPPTPSPSSTPTPPPTVPPTPPTSATPTPRLITPTPTPEICVRLDEGFDGFDTGTRPAGWTFFGCDEDTDTYTTAGNYGIASPSIKLDTDGDYIETAEFLPGEWLQFWAKGQGTDASSSLLVEEYYADWSTVTEIVPLPSAGTIFAGLSLNPSTSQLKFTYLRSLGELALDDVLVKCLITPTPPPTVPPTPAPSPTATPDNYRYRLVLDYSTYLGGSGMDRGRAIAVDSSSCAYVIGISRSLDFPTASAFQPAHAGSWDAVVAKLSSNGESLLYGTYLGGSLADYGIALALDEDGSAWVTGYTSSPDFPTANPYQAARAGEFDAFLAKLSPTGDSLVFSSYLGGSGTDYGLGIAVDREGSPFLTGFTLSGDFPTWNAYQPEHSGTSFYDAFVAKFSADGSSLEYSTYLGGGAADRARSIAVDVEGSAYVAGYTESEDFPTVSAFQPDFGGGLNDVFVSKFSPDGSILVYSTFLGGESVDEGWAIAVNTSGEAFVSGNTLSPDFPVENAFQPNRAGGIAYGDAFLARLSASGDSLVYSTYLGGSGEDRGQRAIAVDGENYAYLAGWTTSTDFPLSRPYQAVHGGGTRDAFAASFYPDGTISYSTYLGGSDNDAAYGAAVDGSRRLYITGETSSGDFPVANALQPVYGGGGFDFFVSRIEKIGYLTTPTPTPSPTPPPTSTPTPRPPTTATPVPTASPTPTPPGYRTPSPTVTPTPTPEIQPTPPYLVVDWDDYSGDGASDLAVYDPGTGEWNILWVTSGLIWGGGPGDIPVPGDYNGDGRADVGYFDRFSGRWYVMSLTKGVLVDGEKWGEWGDVPVPGDYDGDRTTDLATWRPSDGRWRIRDITNVWFGQAAGMIPVPGDYDGDGTTDIAILDPAARTWYVRNNRARVFWFDGAVPLPMDYTGDGTTELGMYRPAAAAYLAHQLEGEMMPIIRFGIVGESIPFIADFTGDGTSELGSFRWTRNKWWIRNTQDSSWSVVDFSAQSTDSLVTGAPAY